MSDNDVDKLYEEMHTLAERIVALETQSKERHAHHGEQLADIKDKITKICENVASFNGAVYKTKDHVIKETREYTNRAVAWAVGTPVLVGVIIGLFLLFK